MKGKVLGALTVAALAAGSIAVPIGGLTSGASTSYKWASIPSARMHSELAAVGLGNVNYGVFKGKTVGVAELAPLEPVFRIEKDFVSCVNKNGGHIKTVSTLGDPAKGVSTITTFEAQHYPIFNDAVDPSTIAPQIALAGARHEPLITMWSGETAKGVGINGSETANAAVLAQYVIDRLHGSGKVAILGSPATQSLRQRDATFRNILTEFPNIHIVTDNAGINVGSPTTSAFSSTQALLLAHPDVNAIWTDFDEIGAGAAQAVDAQSASHPFVVSFNGDLAALSQIRKPNSSFAATMNNDLQISGDVACAEMAAMLTHKTIPAQNLYMAGSLITKQNVSRSGYMFGTGPYTVYPGNPSQRWPS
jgi:ribose transport system substrate-binding protein